MNVFTQLLQFLFSGLTTGSIYALIAIGFSIIQNATGIVNFAQGEFVMLGGMFMITYFGFLKLPMVLAFFLTVASVALVGCLLERGPIRHSRSKEVLILVMITIGASIFMKGLSMMVWGKDTLTLPSFSGDTPTIIFGAAVMPQSLWIFGITIVIVVALHLFFKRSLLGKALRAVAANRKTAMLAGIPVHRMVLFSFGLSGALGAVGGILITPITTTSFNVGLILGLKGFSAAILGGYGSMPGAIVGGLLLGVLESFSAGLISSQFKNAVAFLVLLLVLFFKPSGLFGTKHLRRV